MAHQKKVFLILIVLIAVCLTACGTLDMMVGLKEKANPDVSDLAELSEFEIVEDAVGEEAYEEVIETAAEPQEEVKMTNIMAYFEDEYGFVVPVNTKIPWEEGIAKATLRSMIAGSETEKRIAQSGLHGVIPEGTEIRGMSIKDGLCRVDFSKNILNTSSLEQEENMISAITYALTEFPTIDRVELLVEGQALSSLPNGYAINKGFERENINLYGSEDGVNYTVYFKAPDTEVMGHYVPLTFSATKVGNPVQFVVEKLFEGPPADTTLSNNIPIGINLRDVKVVGDKAVINLGVEAVKLSEQDFRDMSSIVVLCLEQYGIGDVEFNIEGLTFEAAGLFFEDTDARPVFNEY
ncbi:MAG TPA: GerMN domain-containing protein [Sedimentibacter sp.]|nr:GerMN domain-containing protein [Sedimentibacter sp.]